MSAVIGFAGYSGSGKTTLIEQVIALLVLWGVKVSLIKHAHHHFDVDVPGKDSWRHRQAGATEVMVASDQRWALMHELRGAPEPSLDALLERLSPCDLVIVEGFKKDTIPKLEVWRREQGSPRLNADDPWIIALVTDEQQPGLLPCLDINDPEAVAHFIVRRFDLAVSQHRRASLAVKVRYFARLREALQCDSETVQLDSAATVSDLAIKLRARGNTWAEALSDQRTLKVAVNQEIVTFDTVLHNEDEVAFFPPVTGG